MKDFNLKKYLLDNPLTNNSKSLKSGKINEAFDGVGGVISLRPVNEAPVNEDPWGWEKHVAQMRDDETNRKNKWIADLDRLQPEYGDWKASYEYPGIIVWSHADIPDAMVVATPDWEGQGGTPVEFQSENGSTQMLKILDQDDFPTVKSYIAAIAPYLDMVEDANLNPTGEAQPKGTSEFQGVHEADDSFIQAQRGAAGMKTLFVLDYGSGTVYEKMVPGDMQSEEIEAMLADEYGMNPSDVYYMVTSKKEVEDLDNPNMDEGYMGTDYDSSEDMAVDMIKKGIRENDYFDRRRVADDDMRTMSSSNERLEGLVNQRELAKYGEAVMAIAQDLENAGFDTYDIKAFLKKKLDGIIL